MEALESKVCQPCRGDVSKATEEEIKLYQQQVPDWQIIEVEQILKLQRLFQFKNFKEALAFTNRVGAIAEEAKHHPDLLTQWGKVTVTWYTHKLGGLHENDFIMAAKTDRI
ncbi:MAG: 4a-hydroxytetrahydrobiopterin dehydratase [SAR324 cluster bacterium]|uniref:Putative pterin-4-alpha-carbinolamine dehydratase n=1 Tax=SAR324 cluster bacterium TaxID=2024889 RepID=A0A2A4STW1_9DELT|nr:MAG: 4a-hydroxytetrahydrobiopterin dehydratase [SAR324 cluster bacterium]